MSLGKLSSISGLNDKACIEVISEAWGQVQEENFSQRDLVTPEEWDQWDRFNNSQTETLTRIIRNFNGRQLSTQDRSSIEGLGRMISNAKRMSKNQLEDRIREKEEAERKRLRDAEDRMHYDFAENLRKSEAELAAAKARREAKELNNFKSKIFGLFRKSK